MTSSSPDDESTKKPELSEKAREKLRRNQEERERNSLYVSLEIGEKKPYFFDPEKIYDPEPTEWVDAKGKKTVVYPYGVIDPNFPDVEKLFRPRKQLSERIDKLLVEGHRKLMIEKEKGGDKGKYNVYPTS